MEMLNDIVFIPSVTVIVFQGYRVIANSWEVGGRLYAVSNGGVVVALDYPLCHFELRLVASASGDAVGLDADRLEARSAVWRLRLPGSWCPECQARL